MFKINVFKLIIASLGVLTDVSSVNQSDGSSLFSCVGFKSLEPLGRFLDLCRSLDLDRVRDFDLPLDLARRLDRELLRVLKRLRFLGFLSLEPLGRPRDFGRTDV